MLNVSGLAAPDGSIDLASASPRPSVAMADDGFPSTRRLTRPAMFGLSATPTPTISSWSIRSSPRRRLTSSRRLSSKPNPTTGTVLFATYLGGSGTGGTASATPAVRRRREWSTRTSADRPPTARVSADRRHVQLDAARRQQHIFLRRENIARRKAGLQHDPRHWVHRLFRRKRVYRTHL